MEVTIGPATTFAAACVLLVLLLVAAQLCLTINSVQVSLRRRYWPRRAAQFLPWVVVPSLTGGAARRYGVVGARYPWVPLLVGVLLTAGCGAGLAWLPFAPAERRDAWRWLAGPSRLLTSRRAAELSFPPPSESSLEVLVQPTEGSVLAPERLRALIGAHNAIVDASARVDAQPVAYADVCERRGGARVGASCALSSPLSLLLPPTAFDDRLHVAADQRSWVPRQQPTGATSRLSYAELTAELARTAAQCRADDLEWRAAVRASLVPRAPEASGFSSTSIYIESKSLSERRAAEDAAAAALQAARRGTLARRARAAALAAAVVLQAGARRRRAVARALWWRRALGRLRAARRARARWRAGREAARALLPAQRRAVLASLHVGKEVAAVQADAARERRDFEESFRKWAAKMTKTMLARKLPSDWIPQMNTLTGASYFFNLKTGEAAEEHPNLKAAKKTERTQRKLAEEQLSERLATLREYEERLADGRAQVLERYAAEAAAAWATL